MRQQYGLRLNSDEFREMPWAEFADLMAGLSADTPLATIIRIRTGTDGDFIKAFTPAQRAERAAWQRRRAASPDAIAARDAFIRNIQAAFAASFG